jgi:hypothetical protein
MGSIRLYRAFDEKFKSSVNKWSLLDQQYVNDR